jgi:iron(II)-dependent oxidoreductase
MDKAAIRAKLEVVRERTWATLEPCSEEDLLAQHEPIVSPLMWDLNHIAHFEELFLVEDGDPGFMSLPSEANPYEHPRPERGDLDLPSMKAVRSRLRDVRERSLARLAALPEEPEDRYWREGFAHRMVADHERQHRENMIIALDTFPRGDYVPPTRSDPPASRGIDTSDRVQVPGGTFTVGTDLGVGVYDNEAPPHEVDLDPFSIGRFPVTNAQFLEFVEDGGYEDPTYWDENGYYMVAGTGTTSPQPWIRGDDGWYLDGYDRREPLPMEHPVRGVSAFEAKAYAEWAGGRLPTEAEWEAAASWDPDQGAKHRFPWGHEAQDPPANLDARHWQTAPVGAYPGSASPVGAEQIVGDVWEWTATTFDAYEGHEPFPYREYSQPFFGEGYRVLKGGSWITHPNNARTTFRNWWYPRLRHVPAGLRVVWD